MNAPGFLTASLYVALGGGLGAWLRYATGLIWTRALGPVAAGAFPWSTLTVNLVGSFAMGLLAGWLARHDSGDSMRLLLGVGILGGFTTFSAFSLDLAQMVQRGAFGLAAFYTLVSVLGGVLGLFAGLALTRGAA